VIVTNGTKRTSLARLLLLFTFVLGGWCRTGACGSRLGRNRSAGHV